MNITESNNSARLVAAEVLNRYYRAQKRKDTASRSHPDYASTILNDLLNQTTQRQRSTDLVMGTMRHRSSIDLVLSSVAQTPAKRIASNLINYIRIAVYELIYCPQTPDYSIINEACENTKKQGGKKQVGFVNAVLRKISSQIISRCDALAEKNIRQALPQNIFIGCLFAKCFLADPDNQPADYLSAAYSIPRFLIIDWLDQFGFEKTKQICAASNRKAGIYLRPNIIKTNTYELAELLTRAGLNVDITEDDRMIKVQSPGNIVLLPGFAEGLFSVQDHTASLPAIAAKPQTKTKILDMCAAPGTKTIQLAELTVDKADISATDIDANRLYKLNESINRLGLNSITLIHHEKICRLQGKSRLFDLILLDVPCSNTGVLTKRPEVRLRLNEKAIARLTFTQDELLMKASHLLKPKGRICYSTCSVLKDENQSRIKKFLSQNPNYELTEEKLTLPCDDQFDHDGGYYAIIQKGLL